MQKKSLIKQKILYFIDSQGITKYDFYKKTGITRGVLDQNTGLSEDNLARFLAYYSQISVNWLLFDQGPMLKTNTINNTIKEPSSECQEKIKQKEAEILKLNETIADQREAISTLREIVSAQKDLLRQYVGTKKTPIHTSKP